MLIPRYGIIGTALGLVVLSATITSIAMYYAQKIFFPQLFKNLKVVLFSGCVLLSSLLFGKYLFRSPSYSQIASGLLFALMFISIYKNELRLVRERIEKEMIIHRVGLQ